MFRKTKGISISFLLILLGLIYYKTFFSPLMDMNATSPIGKKPILPNEPFQYRTKVSKDLYLPSKGERLHYHLESPTSRLTIEHTENQQLEVTETLDDMELLMCGEELRMIQSERATCYYLQKFLKATDVLFGSIKNDEMVMDGKAKEVSFSFKTRPPEMEASSFQAHFNHKRIK